MLAISLRERGHDTRIADVSEYTAYRTEHEKEIYREAVFSADYAITTPFRSNGHGLLRVRRAISDLLHQSKPHCVIVGLDSDPEQRAVINTCRRFHIPTILVQDGAWIFRYRVQPWHSIMGSLIRSFASSVVRGRFGNARQSIGKTVNQMLSPILLGDMGGCGFGCGGCDRVGVFSSIVRDRLIAEGVRRDSILVTGCLASRLNETGDSEKSSGLIKNKNHVVVISQPFSEVSVDLGQRVFTEVALALGELEILGWNVSIRLHPRETEDNWRKVLQHPGAPIRCDISHDIDWRSGSVVVGFVSTLLGDVVRAGIPLVIYDLAFPVIRQDDLFGIDGVAVCKSSGELVEKITLAESTPIEVLNVAAKQVSERFGLREDALERTIVMIEGIAEQGEY